jgi:RNA polymerase sigma-70 factor, ECF subfamily
LWWAVTTYKKLHALCEQKSFRGAKGCEMVEPVPKVEKMLQIARQAQSSLGELLQHYRPYLLLVAEQEIDPRIVTRVSEADVVQETLAEAAGRFDDFRGSSEPEFSAWITRILHNQLHDAVRVHMLADKRSVNKERPLHRPDGSASLFWFDVAGADSTPSKRLVRGERALRLALIINDLPGRQAEAIKLRFFEGLKIRDIAKAMVLSSAATAGLLKRGLRTLRANLNEASWFSDLSPAPS